MNGNGKRPASTEPEAINEAKRPMMAEANPMASGGAANGVITNSQQLQQIIAPEGKEFCTGSI